MQWEIGDKTMTNITEVSAPTNAGCRSTELSEHNRIPKVWDLFSGVVIADLSISGSILLLCGLFLISYHRFAPVQLPAQCSRRGQ